ncbi:MAG: glycosyltransferase family 87 protein [Pseudomonadota bacterium]
MTQPTRDLALAAALAVGFVALLAAQGWGSVGTDIAPLYLAGYLTAQGQAELIYAAIPSFVGEPVARGWVEASAAAGLENVVAYVYPPLWAALAALLTSMSAPAFSNAAMVATLSAYALTILAAWRLARPALSLPLFTAAALGLSLASLPFLFAWSLVQPQLIVIALTIWSVERLSAGKPTAAGILLGLAAAIKVFPILFALLFVAERQGKAAATALATAAALAALSVLLMGWPAHAAFLAAGSELAQNTLLYGGNLTFSSLAHALIFASDIQSFPPDNTFVPARPWISLTSYAALLLGALATIRATKHLGDIRLSARLTLLTMCFTFFAPLAWAHYYAPLLVLMLAFYGRLPRAPWGIAFFATFAMGISPLGRWFISLPGTTPHLQIYMGAMLAIAAAALIVALRPQRSPLSGA